MKVLLLAVAVAAIAAVPAYGQWEVISIRPCSSNAAPERKDAGGPSPGRLAIDCQTVTELIQQAYEFFAGGRMKIASHFPPIEGGPSWINTDRYRINAKAEGAPPYEAMNGPMLQKLLEDRFKLKMHREAREIPVYALTVAKGGPKLRASQPGSCTPVDLTTPAPAQPGRTLPRPCGMSTTGIKGSNLTGDYRRVSVAEFCEQLNLDRIVIDRTAIAGIFDIHLEFALDDVTSGFLPRRPGTVFPDDPTGGTSIFTAMQEQLGLKLEPSKGPGEFIVVDGVERPSEN